MRAMLGRIKRGVLSGRIAARMDDGGSPDLQRNSIAHQLVRAPLQRDFGCSRCHPGAHGCRARFGRLVCNRIYHAVAWVKAEPGVRVMNYGVTKFDLSARSVVDSTGDIASGVEAAADDWVKLWVDALIGLLEGRDNRKVFEAAGQSLIIGGFEISQTIVTRRTQHPVQRWRGLSFQAMRRVTLWGHQRVRRTQRPHFHGLRRQILHSGIRRVISPGPGHQRFEAISIDPRSHKSGPANASDCQGTRPS
jgi:hypothetical protein